MKERDNSGQNANKQGFERSQDRELWQLMEKASPEPRLNPLFSRSILREIRLDAKNPSSQRAFWKTFWLRPALLIPSAFALLALAFFILQNPFSASKTPSTLAKNADFETLSIEEASLLESSLESELLLVAANSPSTFSDEEVIAMLF